MRIDLVNITHRYSWRAVALHDISLVLSDSSYILAGPNGSGKTTLLRILATHLMQSGGIVRVNGNTIHSPATRARLRQSIGYMPQEISFPEHLTGKQFMVYMAALKGIQQESIHDNKYQSVIDAVHLAEHMNAVIATYSTGMKRRLLLAQALLGSPEILLLDEPFASLDPEEAAAMAQVVVTSGARVIVNATHHIQPRMSLSQQILVLMHGSLIFSGSMSDLIDQTQQTDPQSAIFALVQRHHPTGETTMPVQIHPNPPPQSHTSPLTIQLDHIVKRYGRGKLDDLDDISLTISSIDTHRPQRTQKRRNTIALHDISISIGSGVFGLVGRNGAGKTTLLQIIATLLEPTAGTGTIGPYDLAKHRWEIRHLLGYLPQEHGFYPQMTVRGTLQYFAALQNIEYPRIEVDRVLEAVNLSDVAHKRVKALSGGMRRRLGLAQALLGDPPLLIVDEPTTGLDPIEQQRFRSLLGTLGAQHNRTIILSTHIIEDIEMTAGQVVVLDRGTLQFQGSVSALRASAQNKVWIWRSSLGRIEAMQKDGSILVTSMTSMTTDAAALPIMEARIIANAPPDLAIPREPTLADGYFLLMGGLVE